MGDAGSEEGLADLLESFVWDGHDGNISLWELLAVSREALACMEREK